MNILITGGAGFIGSHLSEKLCKKHKVTIIDNFSTGRISNINKFKRNLVLREGSDWEFFDKKKCDSLQVTPYDKFAIDMFYDLKI